MQSAVAMSAVNYEDYIGRPVCPLCGQPIAAGQSSVTFDNCLIHLACWPQAIVQEITGSDPCEATP